MKKIIFIILIMAVVSISQIISVGENRAIINFGSYEGAKLLIYDDVHELYWYDGSWSSDPNELGGYTSIRYPMEITGLVPGRKYCLKVVGLSGTAYNALSSTYCFNTLVKPIKRFTSWDSIYVDIGVFDTIKGNFMMFFPYNTEPPHVSGLLYLKRSGDVDTLMYWNGIRWVKLIEVGSAGFATLYDGSGIRGGTYNGTSDVTWYIEPSATIDTLGDSIFVKDNSIDSIKIKDKSIATSDIAPTGNNGQVLTIDGGNVVWGDASGTAPSDHAFDVLITNESLEKEWRTQPGLKRATTTNFVIYRY